MTQKTAQRPGEVCQDGRITLRQLVDDDLDFLAQMLGDSEVMRYWPRPLSRAEAEQWLRRQQKRYIDDGCGYWLVVDNQTRKPVGQAGVIMTDVEGKRLPMIGYMIHRLQWRKRYGIDAAWRCIVHILHSRHEPVAYTLIRPENEPSLALARKMGMKPLRMLVHDGFEHVLFAYEET